MYPAVGINEATTIESKLVKRAAILKAWETQFNLEKTQIIEEFAESIFKQVINHVEKTISSPLYSIYTERNGLQLNYTLQMPGHVHPLFKKIIKDDTLIASWLSAHEEDSETHIIKQLGEEGKLAIPAARILQEKANLPCNINYEEINKRLAEIGKFTLQSLKQKFDAYKARKGNEKFSFDVLWSESGRESGVGAWSVHNGINLKVWFVFSEVLKPQVQIKPQSVPERSFTQKFFS